MKTRELSEPLLSEQKHSHKNSTVSIYEALRIQSLNNYVVSFLEEKDISSLKETSRILYGHQPLAIRYANKVQRNILLCFFSKCDCGFISYDPEIDYSCGFTYAACQFMTNNKSYSTIDSAGFSGAAVLCTGVLYDFIYCPVVGVGMSGAFVCGALCDTTYYFDRCYYQKQEIVLAGSEEARRKIKNANKNDLSFAPRRQTML
jgi:hypothetical protein